MTINDKDEYRWLQENIWKNNIRLKNAKHMENNTNNNSLTRLELSDALVREVGLSRHESMQLVDDVLDHLSNSLALGENVKISSFGTFSCRQKKERIGRNPKTGIEAPIIARKVVTFKPSQIMKDKINKGNQKS